MRRIPASSVLPYCSLPALSESSLVGIGADRGANSMPSVRSNPASESTHDLIRRERDNLPGAFAIPRHQGDVVPIHIMTQSSHPQIGLERNLFNCGYYRPPECNDYNLLLHPHHGLTQQRSNINYQQRQQSIGHQPSSPYLTAVGISGLQTSLHDAGATQLMINQRSGLQPNQLSSRGHQPSSPNFTAAGMYGLKASQHNAEAAQQMINQRICLQPNQLSSVNAFQESSQKSNYNSLYAQLYKDEPPRTNRAAATSINENKAIQESQGPTNHGTKDNPIMVSEDSTEWLDSVYQRIQKCKEECLEDVMKIHRHYLSQMPQIKPDGVVKMVFQIEDMIKLLNLQRSSLKHKVVQKVHKNIDGIYFFTRYMRNKCPSLFAGPGEESKSKHGNQRTVLSTVVDENRTHQKQDLPQQEAAAGPEAENSVVSPLQPAKTSTDAHHIDPNQSKNLNQEEVKQSSPIDRLIKAVNDVSPETLMSVSQDIFAIKSVADGIYEIPAYGDGRTYICDDLAAWANNNLHTKEVPTRRIKRNFNVVAVNRDYDIDGLIDSGSRMLKNPQSSKRQKVEVNKNLMTEIEFLNGKLLETQVAIVKPDAGLPTLEGDSEITVSCTFLAASNKALNILAHLFPVRMQLKIPREYPQFKSKPTILSCRHQNCGQMCAMLQTNYERWSRCCQLDSVKEIVENWNACARELYADICSGSSGRSSSAKFDTWETVME